MQLYVEAKLGNLGMKICSRGSVLANCLVELSNSNRRAVRRLFLMHEKTPELAIKFYRFKKTASRVGANGYILRC